MLEARIQICYVWTKFKTDQLNVVVLPVAWMRNPVPSPVRFHRTIIGWPKYRLVWSRVTSNYKRNLWKCTVLRNYELMFEIYMRELYWFGWLCLRSAFLTREWIYSWTFVPITSYSSDTKDNIVLAKGQDSISHLANIQHVGPESCCGAPPHNLIAC